MQKKIKCCLQKEDPLSEIAVFCGENSSQRQFCMSEPYLSVYSLCLEFICCPVGFAPAVDWIINFQVQNPS